MQVVFKIFTVLNFTNIIFKKMRFACWFEIRGFFLVKNFQMSRTLGCLPTRYKFLPVFVYQLFVLSLRRMLTVNDEQVKWLNANILVIVCLRLALVLLSC